jgi:hypothetical protein
MQRQPIRTKVDVEERVKLPTVWIIVLCLVGAGFIAHIVLAYLGFGGLVLWPFIAAVCVLLIINAAAENAVGVPPFQAYALFGGTFVAFFLFVMLVSKVVNPWLVILLVIGSAIYLARDWKERKVKDRELERRRLAGLCVKCCEKVETGIEDVCRNCGTPVNPERLDLFRLGRAISLRSQRASGSAREVLGGTKLGKGELHMQKLMSRPAKYKRGK